MRWRTWTFFTTTSYMHYKYNRLEHKFRQRLTRLCVGTQVYQSQWNNAMQRPLCRSRSFKVTDYGTNRKLIYDFRLVINTNLPPILHRFQVMVSVNLMDTDMCKVLTLCEICYICVWHFTLLQQIERVAENSHTKYFSILLQSCAPKKLRKYVYISVKVTAKKSGALFYAAMV